MVLTLPARAGGVRRQLLVVHVSQLLLELRQHDRIAGILKAGIRRRVPMHRSVLKQLPLLTVESRGLSRRRNRLARHQCLELLALLARAWKLWLQVRRCVELRDLIGVHFLPEGSSSLWANRLRLCLGQVVIAVVGEVEHAPTVLWHDLRVVHCYAELLVPSLLPMASDGLDHGGLVWCPAGDNLVVVLLILRVLEVWSGAENIGRHRIAWLARSSRLRDEDLVLELAQRQRGLWHELTHFVWVGVQLRVCLR